MATPFITFSEVKTLLSISDTSKDVLITALLPLVKQDMQEECNRTFLDADGNDDWPLGTKIVATLMVAELIQSFAGEGESVGLKSESEGGYSYAKEESANGYSVSTMKKLRKFKYASMKHGTITTQWRDQRNLTLRQLARDFAANTMPNVAFSDQEL